MNEEICSKLDETDKYDKLIIKIINDNPQVWNQYLNNEKQSKQELLNIINNETIGRWDYSKIDERLSELKKLNI